MMFALPMSRGYRRTLRLARLTLFWNPSAVPRRGLTASRQSDRPAFPEKNPIFDETIANRAGRAAANGEIQRPASPRQRGKVSVLGDRHHETWRGRSACRHEPASACRPRRSRRAKALQPGIRSSAHRGRSGRRPGNSSLARRRRKQCVARFRSRSRSSS